jgi:hypothetical protein
LTIASAGLEVYIVVLLVSIREFDALKTVIAVLNGTGLAFLFRLFLQVIRKEFLSGGSITENHLATFFGRRVDTVMRIPEIRSRGEYSSLTTHLSQENLRFFEDILRSCYGPHRYQLSVFTNSRHPEISCYYDSAGQHLPRSHQFRQQDPDYYRKQGYEVVDLLEAQARDYIVIPDTHKSKRYSFVNQEQKSTIGSTVLFRFAIDNPGALVVVSDEPNLFQERDSRLYTMVSAVGLAIRLELMLERKMAGALPQ